MRFLLGVLVLAAASACGSPPFIELPNPIDGNITNVTADGFELTTSSGDRFLFRSADPEDPRQGLGHMRQHQFDRIAVRVTWRRDGYELVAVRVEDGRPASSPTPTVGTTPSFSFPLPSRS